MHIAILTVGSRGDVQPYVALGVGLQGAGHTVTVVTDASFEGFVREYGLQFAPLRSELFQLAQSQAGRAALAGKGRLKLIRQVMPMLRQIMDDGWAGAQGAEAIVYHPKAMAGYHIAEKLDIPGFLAMALPAYSPTGAFPQPALGAGDYGRRLNRLTYSLFFAASMIPYRGLINSWRKERLGLPPCSTDRERDGQPVPKLYAYSPRVVPRPDDWDASTFVPGYWFLEQASSWTPPDTLLRFLDDGPAPLYIGFGSMVAQDPARTTQIVLEAVQQAGVRAVLASGWGGLVADRVPQSVHLLEAAPHDWLFPRCAAVVHHGGAGTTGAGLRAGKPTLVCPFFGDQPFWGQRVAALGVGLPPIPQKKLTAPRLADALRALTTTDSLRQRAEALGEEIRAEDGIGNAVKVITGT